MSIDAAFDGLTAFLTVARRRSFRAAARELGVTPGAISQTIRALEERVDCPLFVRTTRSVAMSEEGERLFSRVAPAADAIADAFGKVGARSGSTTGHLRLSVPRLAARLFVPPLLLRFREKHPLVSVEISVDDALLDLQASGFDAGIRIGESIAKDMVAVRMSPRIRWCVAGAPSYFAVHGHPKEPSELLRHLTIRARDGGKTIYQWEFAKKGRIYKIDVPGPITVDDGELSLELAREGLGLAYTADISIARDLAAGALETTLDSHSAKSSGAFLYFPRGAQEQPKLRALVDTVKQMSRG